MEVSPDGALVKVCFVDYGNSEWASVRHLRKQLFLTEVPVQSLRVRLHGVQPKEGGWEQQDLEYLHREVVDKVCWHSDLHCSLTGLFPGVEHQ